jgi:integrase
MASVYKRGTGGKWMMAVVDRNGKQRVRTSGTTDKKTAKQIAAKWEADEAARRNGCIDAILERLTTEGTKAIASHVADFEQFLTDKCRSEKHVIQTCRQIRWIIKTCQAKRIADLTAPAVRRAIAELKSKGAKPTMGSAPRPTGPRTCNGYLTAIKAFTRWLKEQKLLADDSLCGEDGYNEAADRRHVRRELSESEINWLLSTAEKFTLPEHRMTGPDRAIAYRVALGTGFRASELRRLTAESFNLDATPPTITVFGKRQRNDVQPIRVDLAELLRPWLTSFSAGDKVFARLPGDTARMIRSDLKAARLAWIESAEFDAEKKTRRKSDFLKYENAAGQIADFHSTRHTYISGIVNGGASVKTAQELARHSTPVLTIGRYAHTRLDDIKGALDALPSNIAVQSDGPQTTKAASTAGRRAVLLQYERREMAPGMAKLVATACEELEKAVGRSDAANGLYERVYCEPLRVGTARCDQGAGGSRTQSQF